MLAMQMMSVAMQLLQNKGGGAAPSGPTHTGVPQTSAHPQWPQGAVPGMPAHAPHLVHSASAQLLPYTDGHLQRPGDSLHGSGNGAEAGGGEGVQTGNASPQEGGREAPPSSGTVPCMGLKTHVLQAPQYMQGYGFPAMPGMAQGWPPSSMMDQARDSKLRPPAA